MNSSAPGGLKMNKECVARIGLLKWHCRGALLELDLVFQHFRERHGDDLDAQGEAALARTAGRISQWDEMISDPGYKIGRRRQLYLGAARREVTPRTQHWFPRVRGVLPMLFVCLIHDQVMQ